MTRQNNDAKADDARECLARRFGEEYDTDEMVEALAQCGWDPETAFKLGLISLCERECFETKPR